MLLSNLTSAMAPPRPCCWALAGLVQPSRHRAKATAHGHVSRLALFAALCPGRLFQPDRIVAAAARGGRLPKQQCGDEQLPYICVYKYTCIYTTIHFWMVSGIHEDWTTTQLQQKLQAAISMQCRNDLQMLHGGGCLVTITTITVL